MFSDEFLAFGVLWLVEYVDVSVEYVTCGIEVHFLSFRLIDSYVFLL